LEEKHFGPVWFIPGENKGKYPYCHSVYIEGEGILIDPASDRHRLEELRAQEGVRTVWLSHWHEDHFMHMDLFDDLPLWISREDAPPLSDLDVLLEFVPAAVPGIVFLSGGQSAEDATEHLNAMNAMGPQPWQVSFSYGRALQAPVLAAWQGQERNVAVAQQALLGRCRLNGLAREGKYERAMEDDA